jgi:hypothetical protein
VGSPQECREQAEVIARLGVSALIVAATDRDPDGLAERLPEAVIPARAEA